MSSGIIDTRLYDKPLFLARILHLLDGKITEEEKEIIKEHFKIDNCISELKGENKE